MNLLAALLVVVRYTLHNVKTFILVIYCVVLRISFANCIIVLLGLLMSAFGSSSLRTSSVLIIFCSFCGMNWRFFCTFADRRCRSIHARGCLCVALFNILRCFSSFDRLFSRSSNLPPLFLHSFTIKPLDLHWSNTGLTLEQHWPYSYPTFVLRQMTMRYSVTPKSYPREPLIAVWSLLYVRSPYTPLTTALFQHFSKKNPKSFVVSKNLCTFAHYKT